MAAAKVLTVNEAKAITKTAVLNGHTYQYLFAEPTTSGTKPKGTIFLIHGWPDSSFGWRYQIPFLASLGYRVVAPDMMGYGGTDAPAVKSEADLHLYGFKRAADDIAALAREVGASRIILGGHDWGGFIVYRTAQWHPTLVTHIFSVCTPYNAPSPRYVSTQQLVDGPLPNFGYQLHLASGEIEEVVRTREHISQFLNGVHGGRTPKGRYFLDPWKGVDLGLIGQVGPSPLFSEEEMEYFVGRQVKNGLGGTFNWYRNRRANFEDELQLEHKQMDHPVLFIFANKDLVLSKELTAGNRSVKNLVTKEVDAGHWALVQAADAVNGHVGTWLGEVAGGEGGRESKM